MAKNIVNPDKDYARWYQDVIREAELADSAPVRGCMIIRPYGFAIWENIKASLDRSFKDTGHSNVYFPMLIPQSFFEKEAEHVEGFSPELAMVTYAGGKKLDEPLVLRPTSETMFNHMFSKWINSYRDLPMLLNQWANVIRWEMRPRAFLRTTEFLWQEGHTAHANEKEAREETLRMLGVYEDFARNVAAIPVIRGRKTEREKFAGAVASYTIEAMMGNGWALQSGTTHYLGTNFAKAFNTMYLDNSNEQKYVHQSSWGVSTRLIGGVIMVHGDENGLRLPPRLAPVQVVIVPILKDASREETLITSEKIASELKNRDIRVKLDDREGMSPGFKFNYWEVRGVPLRLEIGPRDIEEGYVMLSPRNNPGRDGKFKVALDNVSGELPGLLDKIQEEMLNEATTKLNERTYTAESFEEFTNAINEKPGFYSVWWDGDADDEIRLQQETKATVRCIPLDQTEGSGRCIMTGRKTDVKAILARAY
jgi:prolyl-tRNA synthetase